MKKRIYLKIGRNGSSIKVKAMLKPNYEPLFKGTKHYQPKYLSTVVIALDIDIDDKEFDSARILLEARIESAEPAVEIHQIKNEQNL